MKKKLNIKKLILFLFVLFILVLLLVFGFFCYKLAPVTSKEEVVSYKVELGKSVYDVFADLEKNGFIKDAFALKLYSKIFKSDGIDAGEYSISKSYSAPKIYEILTTDNTLTADEIEFAIKDGDTVKDIANTISEKSGASLEEVLSIFSDKDYLNELISVYWFITDQILSEDIIYPLEGYLYPDTYRVLKDASVKDYINKALENTKNKLEEYKSTILDSGRTAHEVLTFASILQYEGSTYDDMRVIAGVFNNRISDGINLGSDVTTYYANGVKIGERDLYNSEIDNCSNKYNTRCTSLIGLPIGPICSANINAIRASINPENNSYYYFVTDKDGNLYASKTYNEHLNTINRLQKEGLWYEFE